MRAFIFFLFFTLINNSSQAQKFTWATTGGHLPNSSTNGFFGAISTAQDKDGNIYTLDYALNYTQHCQGDSMAPFNQGGTATFIYKFNQDGHLKMMNQVGTVNGGSFLPANIAVDDDGSSYVLGYPNGTNTLITSNGSINISPNKNVIVKFDSIGNYQWHFVTGLGSGSKSCLLQYHQGGIYFQNGVVTLARIGKNGVLTDSLVPDSYINGTAINGFQYKSSSVLSNGDLVFAAYSRCHVTFGTDVLTYFGNPYLSSPILLIKTSPNLTRSWARFFGNGRDPDRNFIPLSVDHQDNIYFGAQVYDSFIVANDIVRNVNNHFTGYGAIAKVNANGVGQWAKPLVSTTMTLPWTMSPSSDQSGIFVAGGYLGNATFGNTTLHGYNNSLPFVAKFDEHGTFLSAFDVLPTHAQTDVLSMIPNKAGGYIIGGKINGFSPAEFGCIKPEMSSGFYLTNFLDMADTLVVPTIINTNNLLTATPTFNGDKQWFYNSAPIPGATGQTYLATQNGNYTVRYISTEGCIDTTMSNHITVSNISIGKVEHQSNYSLFPNPTQDYLYLKTNKPNSQIEIVVKNMLGQTVYEHNQYDINQGIKLSQFGRGIYFIEIKQGNFIETHKVVCL